MSYRKLFDIHKIGLNSNNIGLLLEKFIALGDNSLVTRNEIQKALRQKVLIDKVIDFLLENNLIKETKDGSEEFKVLVEFPKSRNEKEATTYLSQKLFFSTREQIISKLNYFVREKKDGWIVFLDLANSTDDPENSKSYGGNPTLLDKILNKSFPDFIQSVEKSYFNRAEGYLIKQKGDEAHFYFFEERGAKSFISELQDRYEKELSQEIETYNKTRNSKNRFTDEMYLKIFVAKSTTTEPKFDIYKMPDFNNMKAFTFIARAEKSFKETMVKQGQKDVTSNFIVSNYKVYNSMKDIALNSQDGDLEAFYEIN
jgi:hypothetical protein